MFIIMQMQLFVIALMVMIVSTQDDDGCGNYAEVFEFPFVSDKIRNNPDVPHDFGAIASLHTSTTNLGIWTQRCAATVISTRFLITAAHCVTGTERLLRISLGRENLDENPQNWTDTYMILNTFVNPNYNSRSAVRYNDIALLQTEKKIIYRNNIWPMCLPEKESKFPDFTPMLIAGWGRVNQSHRSPILKSAFLKVVKNSRCESLWKQYNQYHNLISAYPQGLTSNVMCAHRRGVDACDGDSGGPLSHQNSAGHHMLIGVIARGVSICADRPVLPGFYTDVASFTDWIHSITGISAPALSNKPQDPPLHCPIAPQTCPLCQVNSGQPRPSSTTLAPLITTEGIPASSGSGLNWDQVGSDNFVRFTERSTWQKGRDICKSHQLDIYQPKDILGVAKYLAEKYGGNRHYWVGAKGNDRAVVWVVSGEQPTRGDPWTHSSEYDLVGADQCMALNTCCGQPAAGTVMGMAGCTYPTPFLCG